jgi:hypothetical protein
MKNLFLVVTISLFLFSCKKDSTSPNNNPTGSTAYVSSIRFVSPQTQQVDSLMYDTAHHIVQFLQYDYDSTGTTPIADSITVVFSFAPNATVPQSYTYSHIGQGDVNDVHDLTYDANSRIIKDTSLSGTGFVTSFSYPTNIIASTILFEGSYYDNQLDSLFLSNGNVTTNRVYYSNMSYTETLSGSGQFGYSSYANPAYYPAIANSVGPLLNLLTYDGFGGYTDFNSKELIDQISGTGGGLPPIPVNINWATDNKGRVGKGTAAGIPGSYIQFYYY